MAERVTALAAPAEDPGSVPSTCVPITSVLGDRVLSSDLRVYCVHTYIQAKHLPNKNVLKKKTAEP